MGMKIWKMQEEMEMGTEIKVVVGRCSMIQDGQDGRSEATGLDADLANLTLNHWY